jgi:hypothetical protein
VSGFGSIKFGGVPFGAPALVVTASPANELSSSRGIDGTSDKYVLNDAGGFVAMDDVAQRVQLLLAFGVRRPAMITPETKARLESDIRAALAVLTTGREPTIKIVSLAIEDDGRDGLNPRLTYKNLTTGTLTTTP